jgi:hypothetical protein
MENIERKTIFSSCRQYRYCLWREWDKKNCSYAMFIGLNPSTADEVADDPTIRRCVNFAKLWGYGALCMTNLFAYRATAPKVMKSHAAPIGPDNNHWLIELSKNSGVIIAAWGTHGIHLQRDQAVIQMLQGKLSCLGLTKGRNPRHPLYVKSDVKPSLLES